MLLSGVRDVCTEVYTELVTRKDRPGKRTEREGYPDLRAPLEAFGILEAHTVTMTEVRGEGNKTEGQQPGG